MIHIYTKAGCNSSIKALKWIQALKVPYQHSPIAQITQDDFYHILSLTDYGFEDIIIKSKIIEKQAELNIEELKIQDAYFWIKEHPYYFKSPIILENKKLLIGWDSENVRQFIPQVYRQIERS